MHSKASSREHHEPQAQPLRLRKSLEVPKNLNCESTSLFLDDDIKFQHQDEFYVGDAFGPPAHSRRHCTYYPLVERGESFFGLGVPASDLSVNVALQSTA